MKRIEDNLRDFCDSIEWTNIYRGPRRRSARYYRGFWVLYGFPDSSVGKESPCNAGNPGSIPRLGRSPGEGIGCPLQYSLASLVAQLVKNLPTMWETWAQSLGWEDPLEKGNPPIFWPGEFHGLYSPWGHKESDMTEQLSFSEVEKKEKGLRRYLKIL